MKATSLIFYFDDQLHVVDDKKYKDLKVSRKVAILNRAIIKFYDTILINRSKNPVFSNWLRPLEQDDKILKKVKGYKDYDLFEYPEMMGSITSSKIDAKKGSCKANFEATPIMDKSAANAINNPMWEPSFDFEQTFRTSDSNGIKYWHKGDFGIENAYLSYLERPPEIHAAGLVRKGDSSGYIYHDGVSIKKDVDLKFGPGAFDPIVNIAVLMATDNGQDLNLQVNKVLNIKQI